LACVAAAIQDYIRKTPPTTESRNALGAWMCEAHNDVNRKLGKPTLPCTQEAIEKRWKDNPICDD
jgi:FAD-linked sulfhydryl oxidase